jgi:hypothetical protein
VLEDWLHLRVDIELVHHRGFFGFWDRVNVARVEGSIEPGDIAVLEPAHRRISDAQAVKGAGQGGNARQTRKVPLSQQQEEVDHQWRK